jgi:hypothetical protein
VNHPIVRAYATSRQAMDAVAKLKSWGFDDQIINLVVPDAPHATAAAAAAATEDAVEFAIKSGYVLAYDAKLHAKAVRSGRSLVTILAPFGTGAIAEDILDRFDPVASGIETKPDYGALWDDAAPLSSALRAPVLLRNPAPASGFLKLPVLSRTGRTLCSVLGIPELSGTGLLGSTSMGVALLSRNPAPLSSLLKLPLLR